MVSRCWLVAAVWFYGFTNYLDRIVLSFAGPSVMKSMAIDPAMFGSILSSFSVGYALSQIPGGLLADRWNARAIFIVAPIFWALFTAITGLVTSPAGFMAVRICLGLSEGIALGSIFKVQSDNFTSKERPMVAAIGLTPITVAPAVAGPIVGFFVAIDGWQAAFFALVVPTLAAAALSYFLIPSEQLIKEAHTETQVTVSDASAWSVFRLPSFWIVSATWFCFNFAYWGYNGWMPSYLAIERHLDVKSAGILSGLPFVFGFVGLLLAGWLGADKLYGRRPQLLCSSYVGAGLSLYFAYASQTLLSSMIGLACSAFFLFGGTSLVYALAADLSPVGSRGTYWGAVSTTGQLGGVFAPWLIGNLVTSTGSFALGFIVMIGFLFVAAILVLLLIPCLASSTAPASMRLRSG